MVQVLGRVVQEGLLVDRWVNLVEVESIDAEWVTEQGYRVWRN